MGNRAFLALTAPLAVVALAACERSGYLPSPTLQLVDSVLLAETDSQFIGLPAGLAIAADGSYLVGDVQLSTIHHYGPDGRYLRSIGRRGEGPGEFRSSPARLAVDGDSLLLVLVGPVLHILDYRTGEFRSSQQLPVSVLTHSFAAKSGRVFFRYVDPTLLATVGVIRLGSDSLQTGGPFPMLLGQSPVIAQGLSEVQVTPLGDGDTIAVAIRSSDYVYVGPLQGPSFDSIHVPVLHRQGSRPDLLEKIAADPENAGLDVYIPSLPTGLDRLSSGHLAYVVSDLQLTDRRFTGKLFVSVVDPGRRRSCPDAEVPAPADPRPLAAFRGDTLLVLVQEVRDTSSAVWVRKYLVETENCMWVASEGGTSG